MNTHARIAEFNTVVKAALQEAVQKLREDTGLQPCRIEVNIIDVTRVGSPDEEYLIASVHSHFRL